MQLWKTDGTDSGTDLVKDLNIGVDVRLTGSLIWRDRLVFSLVDIIDTEDSKMYKSYLYLTDGSSDGTITPDQGIYFDNLVSDGDRIYYCDNPIESGAASGVFVIADPGDAPETLISTPDPQSQFNLAAAGGRVFIFKCDRSYGLTGIGVSESELWLTEGTGASTVMLRSFPGSLRPSHWRALDFIQLAGNSVYFRLSNNELGRDELWRSDGTSQGTVLVLSADSEIIGERLQLGTKLFFPWPAPAPATSLMCLTRQPA